MAYLTGYKNFSVSRSGILNIVGPRIGARFEVDQDLSPLFPYINGSHAEAKYHAAPERIQFSFQGFLCTLYSHEIIAAAFSSKDAARCFGKDMLAYLNEMDEKRDTIKPDFKTEKHLSPVDIYQLLPKTNCGKCGHTSCLALAAYISKGLADSTDCPDFSKPIAQKAVYPIFGKDGNLTSTVELNIPEPQTSMTAPVNPLTGRELEVLSLLAKGSTNREIAESLSISQHTVKSHVTHIYDKLGINDRAQAAVWASTHNLI